MNLFNRQQNSRELSTLLVVSATSFLGTFLVSAVNIALPSIAKDLSLSAVGLSWIITSFLLATALFMLPAGAWGDRSGRNRLFKLGLLLFTLSSLFCYLAPGGYWLIAARFLQGIGAAFTSTTGQAILVSTFPAEKRGQVLGISVASVYAGLALGPILGGFFTLYAGWRSLFLIAAIMGLLTTLITLFFMKEEKRKVQATKKSDRTGTLLFMAGLLALVYGSTLIPSPSGWALMSGALILLLLFWKTEERTELPLLDTTLFTRNRLFTYSSLSALINYTATFAIIFYLSLYLQKIQGLSPRDAGAVIIAQPLMMALFSPMVGRLSDRFEPRYFATAGMAICTSGLGMLAFLTPTTPIWVIMAILVWVGIGFALFSSPNMNTIMSSVDRSSYGQASGLAASMRVFGQIISMSVVTLLFSVHFSDLSMDAVPVPQFLRAMRQGFFIFFLIGIPGIYFSFNRGDVREK
ncbi:MAG: MFS transporter [Proteiniphilum sp.]|nr:MFS transporter [Proteiniphilum sp.]